ncbi:transporter [Mucilaginibacter jinjuensis]|uniref:Transporter n=1 Tax=Mucilaginibacter jinjuensis TaxID=1176721 RepID=A0ABY7TFD1_9SPHI|nr:transporter [Mucilaginibacter jinjuensis]WCT14944.1 transporter [Mucilaginibacter jinjuensis]
MKKTLLVLLTMVCAASTMPSFAQQATEAKIYQNYPVGLQMLQAGYGMQNTNSTVDGAVTIPNKDVKIDVSLYYLRYATFFNFFNKTAGVQLVVPYASIDAKILGVNRKNSGFSDMMVVLGSNIIGGQPLSFAKFLQTPKETIFAWSLAVTAPTGSYSTNKLLNPGGNRWQFKPELAFSKPIKKFDIEVYAAAKFFTTNSETPSLIALKPGSSLKQNAFYSATFHGIYNLNTKFWISFDAASRFGGETTQNDIAENNAQSLLGLGGSATYSPGIHHQIGFSYMGRAAGDSDAPNGHMFALKYSFLFGAKMDQTIRAMKAKAQQQ